MTAWGGETVGETVSARGWAHVHLRREALVQLLAEQAQQLDSQRRTIDWLSAQLRAAAIQRSELSEELEVAENELEEYKARSWASCASV